MLVVAIRRLAARSAVTWDDALVEHNVFLRLAHLAPALLVFYGVQFVPDLHETLSVLIQRVAIATMVLVVALSAGAFLTAINAIYSRDPENRHRPIKGYLQVVKIVFYVVAALLVVSNLMDRSPWVFLSGLGAMAAVLLLIFRDTILGLVASLQLTGNDMVHVGDWIEMPQYGADGDVIDVALHTVKVQNWDKTFTVIPTHKLMETPYKNWRGMQESGGRRIKRAIHIDLNSIKFCDQEMVECFKKIDLIKDYMEAKLADIEQWNTERSVGVENPFNGRQLTNVGTFRAYIEAYLRNHEMIHKEEMTFMVRQMAPGPTGLPLEIYVFTKTVNWIEYEDIQADIFSHLVAAVPQFDLRLFQEPAGADFRAMAGLLPPASE